MITSVATIENVESTTLNDRCSVSAPYLDHRVELRGQVGQIEPVFGGDALQKRVVRCDQLALKLCGEIGQRLHEVRQVAAERGHDQRQRRGDHDRDQRVHEQDRDHRREPFAQAADQRVDQVREQERPDDQQSGRADRGEETQRADEQVQRDRDRRQHLQCVGHTALATRREPAPQSLRRRRPFGCIHGCAASRTAKGQPARSA